MTQAETNKKIGTIIKKYLKLNSITEAKLADQLGIWRETLSRYVTGKRTVSFRILKQIARILNIPMSEFDF